MWQYFLEMPLHTSLHPPSKPRVLIAVIAYNESSIISSLLHQIKLVIKEDISHSYKVLVFDDCSSDDTRLNAVSTGISVISHPLQSGNGMYMIPTYLQYAFDHQFDFVIQIDGDGQHPPHIIPLLVKAARRTASNIVIGSRYLGKKHLFSITSSYFDRIIGSRIIVLLLYLLYSIHITDPTSGLRIYDCKAINYLKDRSYLAFDSLSFISLILKGSLLVSEFPVDMYCRTTGRSEFSFSKKLQFLFTLPYSFFYSLRLRP